MTSNFGQRISNFFHRPLVSGAIHGYAATGFHPAASIASYLLDRTRPQSTPQSNPMINTGGNGGYQPTTTPPSSYGLGGSTGGNAYQPTTPTTPTPPQTDGFGSALDRINSQFSLPAHPYDVPDYVKDYNKGVNPGETELLSEYDKLNNRRNDIYTGKAHNISSRSVCLGANSEYEISRS